MTIIEKRIVEVARITTFLFLMQCLLFSCTSRKQNASVDLTQEQKTAFDALDILQMQMNARHLYATFPGRKHDCFPPDSSFVISQAELLHAMEKLLAEYCKEITSERRNMLAASAVLIQDEYTVKHCYAGSTEIDDSALSNSETKTTGIWILPNVQGRRDIILEW